MEPTYLLYLKRKDNKELWELAQGTEEDFEKRKVICTEQSLDALAENCYFGNPSLEGCRKDQVKPLTQEIHIVKTTYLPVEQSSIDYLAEQAVMGKV